MKRYPGTVTRLDSVTSTNTAARDAHYGHGDIVVAESQSAGRGQRGNSWESAPGENLTFSLVVTPRFLPAGEQFLLSVAVSLALADTLAGYGIDARVKWPNDIYVAGRKVAGILIENDILGENLSRSIIGIGLNVNQREFPAALPNPVSMALAANKKFDLVEILERFRAAFFARYASLEADNGATLMADYHARLYLLDVQAAYRDANGEFAGTIRRVLPSGEIEVEHSGGGTQRYLFKELEFTAARSSLRIRS